MACRCYIRYVFQVIVTKLFQLLTQLPNKSSPRDTLPTPLLKGIERLVLFCLRPHLMTISVIFSQRTELVIQPKLLYFTF
jgi:hypothetical protein